MVPLYPSPDREGIEQAKQFYRKKRGRELTDEEAHEALSSIMRFLYLINLPEVLPETH